MKCEVIRDLLPLYEDNAASEETAQLVREHLADCPDCREELRKMRTPISLPPDEDEEAVKRFLERRAEIRRKQNAKIIPVVSVLAVLIVFCLCYTLIPRSWDSVSRGAEADWVMGSSMYTVFDRAGTADFDIWGIGQDTDPRAMEEILEVLREGSYRAELCNLLNYVPFPFSFQERSLNGIKGSIFLYFVKDNETTIRLMLYDTPDGQLEIYAEGNPNKFYYRTDNSICQAIAALMQEYGENKQ